MRTCLTLLAALSLAVAALGCSSGGGSGDGTGGQGAGAASTPGATASTMPSPSPPTSGTPTDPPETPPGQTAPGRTDSGATIRVSGTVVEGVEPGCLLLEASQSQPYLLIGGDPSVLRPGARVEVTGDLVDNVVSTCQEGRPLSVVSAARQ